MCKSHFCHCITPQNPDFNYSEKVLLFLFLSFFCSLRQGFSHRRSNRRQFISLGYWPLEHCESQDDFFLFWLNSSLNCCYHKQLKYHCFLGLVIVCKTADLVHCAVMRSENSLKKSKQRNIRQCGHKQGGSGLCRLCSLCANFVRTFWHQQPKIYFLENEFKKETIKQSTIQKKRNSFHI